MAADGIKYQHNVKLGLNNQDMFNVYIATKEEITEALELSDEDIQRISNFGDLLRAASAAAPLTLPQQPAQGAFQAAAPAQQDGGHACTHGARTYREGQGNNGPWKGWFCAAQKGDPSRCKTEYVR